MKNIIISFKNVTELSLGLKQNNIANSSQVLFQFFMAEPDYAFIEDVQKLVQREFGNVTVVGCTTDGIINNAEVLVCENLSVLSVTTFEKTKLTATLLSSESEKSNSYELGQKLAKGLLEEDTKVIIAFSDGTYTNGEAFAAGIGSEAPDVVLAGGMAADNGKLEKTYVFDKSRLCDRGVVGVALHSKSLHAVHEYSFDWEPIGKKLLVTKAVENRVYEIEGMRAADVYAKYMGEEVARRLPKIGIEFPLIVQRDGHDIGRAVIARYDDGSLGFAGNIREGEQVRFGVGVVDEILSNNVYKLEKILAQIKYKPEGVFIYSCMARRRFLENYTETELKSLRVFGTMSGFFSYGEFFHYKEEKKNQLLNETMTLLILSESDEKFEYSIEKTLKSSSAPKIYANQVIARLANTISKELEELNSSLQQRIEESKAFIVKQAYFDRLTGLPNRLSLIQRLEESSTELLLLVNINDFTTINDFFGYNTGDEVLKKSADILNSFAKKLGAQTYKLPSDEFVLVVHMEHDYKKIENIMKQICESFANTEFEIDGNLVYVSVTIAAAFANKQKTGLAHADMTLKMAKKSAKQYLIFDEDLQLSKQYARNIQIANSIKSAINSDRIVPYYQAIFSLDTGKIYKYEALVRLVEDDGRVLGPYEFLDVSEKIKLYPKITEIMIEKTFAFFKQNGFSFSLNFAFSDIFNEKTTKFFFEKIAEYDIASQLTIEVLETEELEKNELISQFISDVYASGAKIAIDDFGSGFANFKHMTTIESDYMKIDGSLIRDIVEDKNNRLVVETIVDFAKKLGKKTIAEFVHSKAVYDCVKEIGVDFVQGYYLAEPSPAICEG
jgi:diguanylate cyclase (GGDEF)-like protein